MSAGKFFAGLAFVLVVLIGASVPAHASFSEDYEIGLRAFDAASYDDAQKYLERALAAQSQPIESITINGDSRQPYLPHHFLGLIAFKKGDCKAAAEHWNSQVNKRMLARLNQMRAQEQALLGKCEQLVTDNTAKIESENAAKKAEEAAAEKNASESANKKVAHGPPPEPLLKAFDSFIGGRYADAARINPDAFADTGARFHAYLVRSAARYTLGQLEGDKDMLDNARADAHAAAALDSAAIPDATVFSPRFRAFYAAAAR